MRAEMQEEPMLPLKEAKNMEDDVKILNTKNTTLFISEGETHKAESDLEKETKGVEQVEENIQKR
ncbi:hypothetical protein CWI36_0206p0020 [Hamiltosporidium magnivora]|nr:hypothetical protein CWI36_0206p0020 [Hamiltosporidium magnivora]